MENPKKRRKRRRNPNTMDGGYGYGSGMGTSGRGRNSKNPIRRAIMGYGARTIDSIASRFGINSNLSRRYGSSRYIQSGIKGKAPRFREATPLEYSRMSMFQRMQYDRELERFNKDKARDFKNKDKEAEKAKQNKDVDEFYSPVQYDPFDPYAEVTEKSTVMTDEQRDAFDKLIQLNHDVFDTKDITSEHLGELAPDIQTMHQYLSNSKAFYQEMVYSRDKEQFTIVPQPLANKDYEIFENILVDRNGIYNPEGENYIALGNNNASEVLTKLLNDYQMERASVLYVLVNLFYGHHKKSFGK